MTNGSKVLMGWMIGLCGASGAWIGYHYTSGQRGAAIAGCLVLCWVGMNLSAALMPRAYLTAIANQGEDVNANRSLPFISIVLTGGLYLLVRKTLGAPAIWQPILVVAAVIGLLALARLATAKCD